MQLVGLGLGSCAFILLSGWSLHWDPLSGWMRDRSGCCSVGYRLAGEAEVDTQAIMASIQIQVLFRAGAVWDAPLFTSGSGEQKKCQELMT